MTFDGKTIWITGASSGIGEALAKAFAAQGAHIIMSGRRTDALEQVATGIKTDTLILPFETTDYDVLPAKVEEARNWKGKVDILVNNAGISQRSLALPHDRERRRTYCRNQLCGRSRRRAAPHCLLCRQTWADRLYGCAARRNRKAA